MTRQISKRANLFYLNPKKNYNTKKKSRGFFFGCAVHKLVIDFSTFFDARFHARARS